MPVITPEELFRVIEDMNFNLDGLLMDPQRVRRQYLSNIVNKSLAVLVGQAGTGLKLLECTEDGYLKAVLVDDVYDSYDVQSGNTVSAVSWTTLAFGSQCSRVAVDVDGDDVHVQFSIDGVVWGDSIKILDGGSISVPLSVHSYRFRLVSGTTSTDVQAIGYY